MFPTFDPDVRQRWARELPFLVVGAVGIVAGGFVAAVAGAVTWGHGAWTAAFAVLVVGVAQLVLGMAQAALAPTVSSSGRVALQCVLWNVGCAGVIAGTQIGATAVVASGSAFFLAALAMSEMVVRPHSDLTGVPRTLLQIYRILLAILLVSVVIGIIFSIAGQ